MDPKPPSQRRRTTASSGASLLALAALSSTGCSAEPAETFASAPQAIAGGTVDTAHHHVFFLASRVGRCTATLIAPNLLLTARHCVSPGTGDEHVLCGESVLSEPVPAASFIAMNDPHPSENSPVFRASEVRVPGEGEDTCGYDIALITLSENVPESVSTPAVPRIDRAVTPGEKYTAVGYGVDADGDSNGSRMQLADLSVACPPGSCGGRAESTEFLGETGACSGDSGGPALDEDGKVVGVVSRSGPDCSGPVYGTVTAWRDFIIEVASDAAKAGGYEPPFWVTTRSSDPPSVGGASGAPSVVEDEPCVSTAECGAGEVCQTVGGESRCVLPTQRADESGCAVAPGSSHSAAVAALFGLLLLRRRRRG